jgi:hypothetical protein
MALRHIGGFALSVLLAAPFAFGVENGKAEGTITINHKPVKLKYAFAKKEKDFDKKDRWIVMLTDRAVSRSLLADDSRFAKAVENGEVVAAMLRFDEGRKLEQVEVRSKALQHKSLPMSASNVKLTALVFTADVIEAGAATTEEQSFFTDIATLDVKFRAPLGKEGKFGDSAAAAKELGASGPKLADGGAAGTLKVDGATVKLAYAIARTKPNAFDEKKKDVVVLLTQQPVSAEMFIDDQRLFKAVSDGSVQGLLVTIDSDEKPYALQLLHPKAGIQMSGSGFLNFDATDFSDTHVAGKFFTTSEQDSMEHKYSYDVSFAAPVQTIAIPSELTVDASSGTKLPAGGGDPGKTYTAFDKASRAGNLAEMKKYASKTRPLPEMNAEETKQMIELMKMMRPAKLKIIGGYVSGDHATLNAEGEDPSDKSKMHGTIEMAREDGAWKILVEKWKQ